MITPEEIIAVCDTDKDKKVSKKEGLACVEQHGAPTDVV
jgi:hypothetical protein